MKKLLYLVTEDWYFWSHRLNLAESALKDNYHVIVVTNKGKYFEKINAKGFEFIHIPICRSVGTLFHELETLIKLVRIYRRTKPDLVHHVALKPIILGTIAAGFSNTPNVINSYTGLGYLFTNRKTPRSIFIRKFLLPLISFLFKRKNIWSIVQNPDDLEELIRCNLVVKNRTRMIPGSGVDTSLFKPSGFPDDRKPVVLFASRLLKNKGINEFVESARIVKNKNILAKFIIVGDVDKGNPTSIDTNNLKRWTIEGLVEWWGYREHMPEIINMAHIICLPSWREGIPKILLEAAASGRPIVSTDVPGCRDIVKHGENGLLVPARDSNALAEAIARLILDKNLRIKMGEAGRKLIISKYTVAMINGQTLDLYRQLI